MAKLRLPILVLIPVRGGSKRLPGKHAMPLAGKTLIERVAAVASALPKPDYLSIVSTDDGALADAAVRAGLQAPFIRPAELATDSAASVDVAIHALDWWRSQHGSDPEILVLLQATTPFRDPTSIVDACDILQSSSDVDAVIGVKDLHRTSADVFTTDQKNNLVPLSVAGKASPLVTVNGALYAVRVAALRQGKTFFPAKLRGIVMDMVRSVDIDSAEDWFVAETIASRDQLPPLARGRP